MILTTTYQGRTLRFVLKDEPLTLLSWYYNGTIQWWTP